MTLNIKNMNQSKTFAFGKNWERLVKKYYNEERLKVAEDSFRDFLGLDLAGKTFLDVGSGSGLYSLAAYKLGAEVISFDVDGDAVWCTQYLKEKAGKPNNWTIYQGSILDKEFLNTLPKVDIVYSYGVLHHTGKMWEALANIKALVKDDGYLCVAIYNKVYGFFGGSRTWEIKKQIYGRLPKILQYLWEGLHVLRHNFLPHIIRFKNPFATWRKVYKKRGESMLCDLRD